MPIEEQNLFYEKGLFLFPKWSSAVPITRQYLSNLKILPNDPLYGAFGGRQSPICVVNATYFNTYGLPKKKNHFLGGSSSEGLPSSVGLAIGAQVLLLSNIVQEMGLYNGAIGTIQEIVFATEAGCTADFKQKPLYVVVDFPGLEWKTEEDVWDINHRSFFPVSYLEQRCERGCCTMTQLPINVAKGITIHKSQGMTIGPGEVCERYVLSLGDDTCRVANQPGRCSPCWPFQG